VGGQKKKLRKKGEKKQSENHSTAVGPVKRGAQEQRDKTWLRPVRHKGVENSCFNDKE